jgi:predicted O-methyltransferase YrrM
MEPVDNLRKLKYVMKSVKQWAKTALDLSQWRENGLRQINIKFKDLQEFQNVTLGTAWAMISYYYWAHQINAYDKGDLRELYKIGEEIYSNIRNECKSWPRGGWGLQGTHGILFLAIRKYKPKVFVETGIASGYSSSIILTAMKLNGFGQLISIDINDSVTICDLVKEIGWLVPESLRENWSKRIGSSKEKLSEINEPIDVFYHDSDHSKENMLMEFNWASIHLKKGGVLISDDIDWNSAWKEFLETNRFFRKIIETVSTGVAIKID